MCQDNPEGPSSFQTPIGSAQVIWPVIQLDPSLCLTLFLPSWFHSVDPKGTPDTHPSTKLHPSLHPREPACNMYQKIFQYWGGFLLKITGYTCICNSLKPPNKTQNGRNKNLLCECGYLWFKIHYLMLSDQMKLSYMLITKENYMLNHMKLPVYHFYKKDWMLAVPHG